MSLVAKDAPQAPPHPEGQFVAVCCDIVDLGLKKSEWAGKVTMKHKIRVVYQTTERKTLNDGREFTATVSQQFTLSLSEKGNLRPFLESWIGRRLSQQALNNGVDLETLIGHNALVTVAHSEDGKYANIMAISPLPGAMQGSAIKVSKDYIRVKDRTDTTAPAAMQRDNERASVKVAENPRITDVLNQERRTIVMPGAADDGGPARVSVPERTIGGDFDDFPEPLKDKEDDLPF